MTNGTAAAGPAVNAKKSRDLLWKLGGGPFALELYHLFLEAMGDDINLSYLSKEHLNKLLIYSIDDKLSEKIYVELRDRVFRHKSRESIIVNEIKGMYEFLSSCKNYIGLTLKMHWKFNGKQK